MSSTIWKYELDIADRQAVRMPGITQVLSVAMQDDKLCMWARVNPENKLYDYTVAICGTGLPAPEDTDKEWWSFIGTVLINGGSLVLHVFVLTDLAEIEPAEGGDKDSND